MAHSEGEKEIKKEIAGEIHDIVEDTIWSDYVRLPELSRKILSFPRYESVK